MSELRCVSRTPPGEIKLVTTISRRQSTGPGKPVIAITLEDMLSEGRGRVKKGMHYLNLAGRAALV